jgi:hypothetical protein
MGHAITGGRFFNIDVEPIRDDGQGDQFAAVVKFKGSTLSETQLSDELKNLVDDLWDWQVTKVTELEFTVRFPSRATLKMSTGSGKVVPTPEQDRRGDSGGILGPPSRGRRSRRLWCG